MERGFAPMKDTIYLDFKCFNHNESEQKIIDLAMLKYGEYGKKINLELLGTGKLEGKTFKDIANPVELELSVVKCQQNNPEIAEEMEVLYKAIRFSYDLIRFFDNSAQNQKSRSRSIKQSLLSSVLYFEIQGHYTLEFMMEKLKSDPVGYFMDKAEAERKAV
ncbi:MAG: hypothetical protein RI981_248 [Bacteroidota bacterium]|jgi:hypothetical protein